MNGHPSPLQGLVRYVPRMIPEWANFLSPERYARFIEAVQAENALVDAEVGTWKTSENGTSHSLIPLAQIGNATDESEWPEAIRHFIAAAERHAADGIPTDLETLRPLLKVRLYSPELLGNAPTVKVPLAAGLVICVAVDLPESVQTLPRDLARTLGLSSEELFNLGLANVQATVQAERTDRELKNGGRIVSLAGDDFFTTSLALALDEYAAPEPVHGYLVAVPNRHEIIAVPLESGRSLGVLPALVSLSRDMFQRGPGSLSPYVYWVRRRRWAEVQIEESEKGIGIAGPEPFVEEVVKPLLKS